MRCCLHCARPTVGKTSTGDTEIDQAGAHFCHTHLGQQTRLIREEQQFDEFDSLMRTPPTAHS